MKNRTHCVTPTVFQCPRSSFRKYQRFCSCWKSQTFKSEEISETFGHQEHVQKQKRVLLKKTTIGITAIYFLKGGVGEVIQRIVFSNTLILKVTSVAETTKNKYQAMICNNLFCILSLVSFFSEAHLIVFPLSHFSFELTSKAVSPLGGLFRLASGW